MMNPTPPRIAALENGPAYVKLLVPSNAAGALIGKEGKVLAELEKETGCVIRLSGNQITFPGTSDRVMALAGPHENLQSGLGVVLDRVRTATSLPGQDLGSDFFTTKLVVPATSVSAIIGTKGNSIRNIQETSGVKNIRITSREETAFQERIITIEGSVESVGNSCQMIVSILQQDTNLKAHMFLQYLNSSPPGSPAGMMGGAHWNPVAGLAFGGFPQVPQYAQYMYNNDLQHENCEIIIQVPDKNMGAVIGRDGRNLQEIQTQTSAHLRISQRGDFVDGTQDRTVMIDGPVQAVHMAHLMLIQRINESSPTERGTGGSPPRFSGTTKQSSRPLSEVRAN